ncbi:MAG: hypothetical protein K2J97_05380 [Muribaculaceae bacterium]|nr:hypothetical protein [Muribaculaceae bacterium]
MIQNRWGTEVRYAKDCEALAESIFEVTGQRLGVTTVKRMFGFVGNDRVVPRSSTMDIIAAYLGYNGGMKAVVGALDAGVNISLFVDDNWSDIENLATGAQVKFSYRPDRTIVMTHLGGCVFEIDEALNSKLVEGDVVKVSYLAVGFEFVASQVVREGECLGGYHSAKCGGVSSVEML